MNLITVYGWKNTKDRFVAVFSRHTGLFGPTPSQLHGSCLALHGITEEELRRMTLEALTRGREKSR